MSDIPDSDFKFARGDVVRDKITGFEGVVIARVDSLQGCNRYGVQPEKLDNGKMLDSVTLDEQSLELVSAKKHKTFKEEEQELVGAGAAPRRPGPAPSRDTRPSIPQSRH